MTLNTAYLTQVSQDDHVGESIALLTSAVEVLKDMVLLANPNRDKNLDRMANNKDFDTLCRSLAQLQLVASSVEVRMIANVEVK
jgi:hypothetical protein